jgi:hypothetical protein
MQSRASQVKTVTRRCPQTLLARRCATGRCKKRHNLLDPMVFTSLLFPAMTMKSVGVATFKMIEEVRRQFRDIPGIMEGTGDPDYAQCVAISTKAAVCESGAFGTRKSTAMCRAFLGKETTVGGFSRDWPVQGPRPAPAQIRIPY